MNWRGIIPLGWLTITLVATLLCALWGYRYRKTILWAVSGVLNQFRYWYHLSFEHDLQPQWAGLTRHDMSRARAKAKRMRAKGPGSPLPEGTPCATHVGHRMRASRRYRRAKRRGDLVQPPAMVQPVEEVPIVPPPAPKVRLSRPSPRSPRRTRACLRNQKAAK
jgi:hypothetical protein